MSRHPLPGCARGTLMSTTSEELRTRLIEVIRDVREQLRYLEALGATHLEDVSRDPAARAATELLMSVLESHEETLPSPDAIPEEAHSEGELMASKKRSAPPAVAPPERASEQPALFGDLSLFPEAPTTEDRTLEEIRADVGDCTRCKLHRSRSTIVFGEGDPHARIMFVGEGPGAEEDAQGRPFVGRAGQLLNRMIEAMGFRREEVYITNVIMCRPPNNRTPEPDEIATCEPFLFRKIRVIRPDVVVALGAIAAQSLLGTKAPIGQIRGRFFDAHGTKIMPTFHPAFLLRAPERKREAWEDLRKVRDYIRSLSQSERPTR